MTEQLLLIALLSLASGSIALTLTRSKIFRPFRRALVAAEAAAPAGSWTEVVFGFLHELSRCCYCMCHWVSIAAFFAFRPVLYPQTFLNAALCVFVIVTLSVLVSGMLYSCASAVEPRDDSK